MPEPSHRNDAEKSRFEVSRARRSLFIIFGVGGIGTIFAIWYVMAHLPEGSLNTEEVVRAPFPGAAPYGAVPPAPVCKKFGDSCEFLPGKLGACVQRENCTGANCLFCQSQH